MKVAAVHAIAALAHAEVPDAVAAAYKGAGLRFGREYLIPKPFDPRLISVVAPAVAKAAADSGVARRPIADLEAYRQKLDARSVFARAKRAEHSVLFAEGEDERVLRAAQIIVDERIATPLLLGRSDVIAKKIGELDLRLEPGQAVHIIDPRDPQVYTKAAEAYYVARKRDGVSRALALSQMRANNSLLAAWLLEHGEADAMLCGAFGRPLDHLAAIRDVIGLRPGVHTLAVMQMLLLPRHQLFICDTHYNADPDAEQITEIALLAAEEVRRFGVTPRIALLSHSSFGTSDLPSARKMRQARELIRRRNPHLAVEGEMRGDAALSPDILHDKMPDSDFVGPANLLVMPNLDAANISYNLLRAAAGNGVTIGGTIPVKGGFISVHFNWFRARFDHQNQTSVRTIHTLPVAFLDSARHLYQRRRTCNLLCYSCV